MKKNVIGALVAGAMAASTMMAVPVMAEEVDLSQVKVGVCIYQMSDNFMNLFQEELVNYLVEQGFSRDNIMLADGNNDQATQTTQIDAYIVDEVDVLIINMVTPDAASTVTDAAVAAGIPVVYINREPNEDEEARWESEGMAVTYVGADARQSGTMQGELLIDLGLEALDLNGNGKVDYVMIEGDPENVDAQYRTEYSIKALEDAGIEVNCLDDQVANWEQSQAAEKVATSLSMYGDDIEVILCNNDAMALGALQSIEAAGRTVGEDIYLVGVDALTEALADIQEGRLTGTVFNDHISQSHAAADAAINFVKGETNDYKIVCDYVKVTSDNVEEIQAMLGGEAETEAE